MLDYYEFEELKRTSGAKFNSSTPSWLVDHYENIGVPYSNILRIDFLDIESCYVVTVGDERLIVIGKSISGFIAVNDMTQEVLYSVSSEVFYFNKSLSVFLVFMKIYEQIVKMGDLDWSTRVERIDKEFNQIDSKALSCYLYGWSVVMEEIRNID